MKTNEREVLASICHEIGGKRAQVVQLYPGIELSFFCVSGTQAVHFCHEPMAQILEINYCISGRIGWNMRNGTHIYLGPGDFSLNTMDVCQNSTITMPSGSYKGLAIYIDLEQISRRPPAPLEGTNLGTLLLEKYCKDGACTALAGNQTVQPIFEAFYQSSEKVRLAYQKIKVLELLLVLSEMEISHEKHLTEYRSQQVEVIRQIHDQLIHNLQERCSIEALSKQYLINPTTLKSMFKAIYGTSIAAHIREHRMEYAAHLLQSSNLSIADIALQVGYDSQSRFSSVFKNQYDMLPKEYRKRYRKPAAPNDDVKQDALCIE